MDRIPEYVFGTAWVSGIEVETLKTVAGEHTYLSGRQSVVREYFDRVIEDTFTVREKYDSKEDVEGRCYDFYVIENHSRDTDRFMPQKESIEAQIEYIAMMTDVELDDLKGDNNGAQQEV